MKVRTMRDIPTIQGLKNQATPATREQAITEVARLEHELSRLRRELEMWTANQTKTAERIRRVEDRLALLKGVVDPCKEGASERPRAVPRARRISSENPTLAECEDRRFSILRGYYSLTRRHHACLGITEAHSHSCAHPWLGLHCHPYRSGRDRWPRLRETEHLQHALARLRMHW
jgi:hypothetical protein